MACFLLERLISHPIKMFLESLVMGGIQLKVSGYTTADPVTLSITNLDLFTSVL